MCRCENYVKHSGKAKWPGGGQTAPAYNRYYIFMARYSKTPPTLKGDGKYNIWQYSEKGHIDGIRGTVDLDRFCNGTTLYDIRL